MIAQGLQFSDAKSHRWTSPFPLTFVLKVTHRLNTFQHHNLDQYLFITPQPPELVRKIQLALIGSRQRGRPPMPPTAEAVIDVGDRPAGGVCLCRRAMHV